MYSFCDRFQNNEYSLFDQNFVFAERRSLEDIYQVIRGYNYRYDSDIFQTLTIKNAPLCYGKNARIEPEITDEKCTDLVIDIFGSAEARNQLFSTFKEAVSGLYNITFDAEYTQAAPIEYKRQCANTFSVLKTALMYAMCVLEPEFMYLMYRFYELNPYGVAMPVREATNDPDDARAIMVSGGATSFDMMYLSAVLKHTRFSLLFHTGTIGYLYQYEKQMYDLYKSRHLISDVGALFDMKDDTEASFNRHMTGFFVDFDRFMYMQMPYNIFTAYLEYSRYKLQDVQKDPSLWLPKAYEAAKGLGMSSRITQDEFMKTYLNVAPANSVDISRRIEYFKKIPVRLQNTLTQLMNYQVLFPGDYLYRLNEMFTNSTQKTANNTYERSTRALMNAAHPYPGLTADMLKENAATVIKLDAPDRLYDLVNRALGLNPNSIVCVESYIVGPFNHIDVRSYNPKQINSRYHSKKQNYAIRNVIWYDGHIQDTARIFTANSITSDDIAAYLHRLPTKFDFKTYFDVKNGTEFVLKGLDNPETRKINSYLNGIFNHLTSSIWNSTIDAPNASENTIAENARIRNNLINTYVSVGLELTGAPSSRNILDSIQHTVQQKMTFICSKILDVLFKNRPRLFITQGGLIGW